MLTEYIQVAMRQANYKILEDRTFFGEIASFEGLWANAPTLEECRDELQSTLEDWIVVGIRRGHSLPIVDGVDL